MKTFITHYDEVIKIDISRTYWKEGNKVYVRYITKDINIKEELCTNQKVEQFILSINPIPFYKVETKNHTYHRIISEEEMKYIASLANLTFKPIQQKK
jgi:hypothetical protein